VLGALVRLINVSISRVRLLGVIAVLPLVACGGTVEPSQPTIPAHQPARRATATTAPSRSVSARIREALFSDDNFGPSWARDDKSPPHVSCEAVDPWRGAQMRRWSPIYRSDYVAAQEIVAAFAERREAGDARDALASGRAQRCFFRTVTNEAEAESPAADFEPARELRSDVPHRGVEATRAEMKTTNGAAPGAVYIDQIRAQRSSFVASAVIVASAAPLNDSLYETLVEIVADRLRAAVEQP
jgi:hypothetical protein